MYPPTGWEPLPDDKRPPDCALQREFVYGYNGSCKRSVHLISDEECIYPAAALVVVQSLVDIGQQRFFEGHCRGVLCVHYNERRAICASGQSDPKGRGGPYICIWAPAHCDRTISQLHGHTRQVSALAMSPDGQTLVSCGGDDAHSMCIWRDFARWDGRSGPDKDRLGFSVPMETKAPIHTISTGRVPIRCIFMGPSSGEQQQQQRTMSFYTTGHGEPDAAGNCPSGQFKAWSISVGKTPGEEPVISGKRGVFGKAAVPRVMTCIAFAEEFGTALMTGDNGYFYVLTNGTVTQNSRIVPPTSKASLGCVAVLPGGRWIAGASNGDLYIGRCDPAPRVEETIRAAALIGPEGELFCSTAQMKLADMQVRGSRVLLGTSNHALCLGDLAQRGTGNVLQISHAEEAWALDFHPSLAILVTASSAKDIRFWNVAERRPAIGKVLKVENAVFSLAFNPEGSLLAAGCGAGVLEVYGFPSLQPVFKQAISHDGERLSQVRFSADGLMLAAACWDQAIFLLKVVLPATQDPYGGPATTAPRMVMHKVLTGNSSSPLCIMFSADGEYLMSNSKDTQILFWRTKDGSRNSAISAYRDTAWQHPWTCVLGWPVLGLWGDPNYDQTDINSVCQSSAPREGYVALGDDYGKIKLFRFPSPFTDPPCRVYSGHSSHVTRLKFSRTNVLAALGGDDHTISQWTLEAAGRSERPQAQPLVHPWVQVEEAQGGPRDRFGFLGRPRAASATRAEEGMSAQLGDGQRARQGAPGRPPLNQRPGSGGSGRGAPAAAQGRRPASASGLRRQDPNGAPRPADKQASRQQDKLKQLSSQKAEAIAREDFEAAQFIKAQMEDLQSGHSSGAGGPPARGAAAPAARAPSGRQAHGWPTPGAAALNAALPLPRMDSPARTGYVRNSSNSVASAMRWD